MAAYDEATDLLKTFLASSPGRNDLVRYEARLSESPSLAEILRTGRPRVVDDLELFRRGRHLHTKIITEDGFRSSYTVPMFLDGAFWGFIFFNSRAACSITEDALRTLDVYAHLISAIVTAEMLAVRILAAAVKTAHDMVHYRDPETGGHIDRMARYARLIAQHLAATGAASLDDAAIERIFEFAPLHDIGKLALPDRILLKPGRLSEAEREEMKQHTVRGLQMIDAIAHNFGLDHLDGLDLLRHIAESHHETMDGGGYPHGLHERRDSAGGAHRRRRGRLRRPYQPAPLQAFVDQRRGLRVAAQAGALQVRRGLRRRAAVQREEGEGDPGAVPGTRCGSAAWARGSIRTGRRRSHRHRPRPCSPRRRRETLCVRGRPEPRLKEGNKKTWRKDPMFSSASSTRN